MTDFSKEELSKLTIIKLKSLAKEHNINKCSNKKKDVLVDYLFVELQRKKERIENDDHKFHKLKKSVVEYQDETGVDFIEELFHIKKMNENIHGLIESTKKSAQEISKKMSNLKMDEFKDFHPDVYTHEFNDIDMLTFSTKKSTEQYNFFTKIIKELKFSDIIILSNNDEVKKIYHVAEKELVEDISLCDADWMSLGIPKEISKKFNNIDKLLRIYKNSVIEAHEFSDDYLCVQLESNHSFLKKKFDDIKEKHIEMMKEWDIRYLFDGEPFQEINNQDNVYENVENNGLKNDFEIITPKYNERYHCSEYYQRSIKKLINSYI